MVDALKRNHEFVRRSGPVVLVIMDGVGFGKYADGDAFLKAYTPELDNLMQTCPFTKLKAHGLAVGMPSNADMGNSEVGHNAIGCGRVFSQGAKLVEDAIETGKMFDGETWKKAVANVKDNNSTMHFIGLFSDGNVHSNIRHLKAMIADAQKEGVTTIRIHTLLDGRDVSETSALDYVDPFEDFLKALNREGVDYRIASGGGRMQITMDRYGANWDMVRKGWEIHILGKGDYYKNAHDAIVDLRDKSGAIDQDLPAFVISDDGSNPIGSVEDGDSVIFFNFRGDRALEITAAFEEGDEFDHFDRVRVPKVFYAGMMEYDGDLHVPKNYLVNPPEIDRTMGEFLCASGEKQLAISETQKFGHVTYFFNGNRLGKFDEKLEDYVEIRSDVVPFEQRPWMKAAEITDKVADAIENADYGMIRLNLANGDMVGHTGDFQAVLVAMGTVDLCIKRIHKAVEKAGGIMVISADHGNSDDMLEHNKKTGEILVDNETGLNRRKTSHSLNPVPCIIFDPESKGEYKHELKSGLGISSLAATCIELLGYEAPEGYDPSVLQFK
ncbi:MAG: 2,3-bisphosphoglycerate-independent phosphoglycerate mutase [Lentisphaerae bacterium]|nr:2,3-bisphosphoglycerate-independent phosphoglycerate mutase [Lentisphaerota bacterium]MCP4102491.1 2,3-bisphosphoglycerate-independent phosphoglycerate mutase [Lentisphaerota bacterium]